MIMVMIFLAMLVPVLFLTLFPVTRAGVVAMPHMRIDRGIIHVDRLALVANGMLMVLGSRDAAGREQRREHYRNKISDLHNVSSLHVTLISNAYLTTPDDIRPPAEIVFR